jgi:phosphatidylglycerophosphate synthase
MLSRFPSGFRIRSQEGPMPDKAFVQAARVVNGVSASLERRVLLWLAKRMPAAVGSDHLTAVGFLAMIGAGACYWLARSHHLALIGVVFCLGLNWFGDSLDGTVARVRRQERPRYGFYVDHTLDMFGALCLLGGLALSGFMTPLVALGLLVSYLMLTTEVYLATYCLASFRLSFFKVGPTELRILLAIGTLVLLVKPTASVFDRYLLFDVGAAVGMIGLGVSLVTAAVCHTIDLYRAEPLPTLKRSETGSISPLI